MTHAIEGLIYAIGIIVMGTIVRRIWDVLVEGRP